MRRAAVVAGMATGAIHASVVVALLAAVEPASRPATGERAPLGVWLIPMSPIASDRDSDVQGVNGESLCTRLLEIDEQGRLYDIGPPSRAFLRSLPAGSDGNFPRIGILCRQAGSPPMRAWSKRRAGRPVEPSPWDFDEPLGVVLI